MVEVPDGLEVYDIAQTYSELKEEGDAWLLFDDDMLSNSRAFSYPTPDPPPAYLRGSAIPPPETPSIRRSSHARADSNGRRLQVGPSEGQWYACLVAFIGILIFILCRFQNPSLVPTPVVGPNDSQHKQIVRPVPELVNWASYELGARVVPEGTRLDSENWFLRWWAGPRFDLNRLITQDVPDLCVPVTDSTFQLLLPQYACLKTITISTIGPVIARVEAFRADNTLVVMYSDDPSTNETVVDMKGVRAHSLSINLRTPSERACVYRIKAFGER